MKRIIFLSLLFIIVLFSKGQSIKLKVDYDCFLLGTLDDYMGREKYKKIDDRVDLYSQSHKSLVFFLDSIFQDKYPDLTLNEKEGRLDLQSKLLAQKVNDFYFFKPSSRRSYNGEVDLGTLNLDSLTKTDDFYTKYFDSVYVGHIKNDVFKKDFERLSFIAGAYIRFGGEKDSLCFISIPNSVSKVKVLTEQLKELKCTNVNYMVKKDYIPVGHTVYFTPSDELKKYIETINQEIAIVSKKKEAMNNSEPQ